MKIFIGWDSREDIAYQVCRHSLLKHTEGDLGIFPLKQQSLREIGLYDRPVDARASTEFSLTRFLTPFLAGKTGWSVFVDCDFLYTVDIRDLLDVVSQDKAVYVVKHDYTPAFEKKMDGKSQATYPRKNWSSFIVFNNAHPKVQSLTPDMINSASPADLHRFNWLDDDDIGELDLKWNFLVGEYPKPDQTPAAIHYTNGGPWFEEWQSVDYGDLWLEEKRDFLSAKST